MAGNEAMDSTWQEEGNIAAGMEILPTIEQLVEVMNTLNNAVSNLCNLYANFSEPGFYNGSAKEDILAYYGTMIQHVSRIRDLYGAGMSYGNEAINQMLKLDEWLSTFYTYGISDNNTGD